MNVMLRKKVLLCFVLSLMVIIVAACGGDDQKSSETPSEQPAAQTSQAPTTSEKPAEPPQPQPFTIDKPVTLYVKNVWGSYDNPADMFQREYADPVQKKYPNVTLKLTPGNLNDESIAVKEPMDIIAGSVAFLGNVQSYGLGIDMEPLVKKHNFDLSRLYQEAIEAGKTITGGTLSYIPINITHSAPVLYNKDLFDKFGQEYPKDGMTWDQIYELAKNLTRLDGDQQYLGFTTSVGHYVRRNQLAINVVDPQTHKVSLLNDDSKSLIENILRFYTLEGYDPVRDHTGSARSRDGFTVDRNVAMFATLSGYTPTEETLAGMNWDAATYPTWPGKPAVGPMVYPVFMGVSSTTEYPDEAFHVISFMTSDEFQIDKMKSAVFVSTLVSDDVRKTYGSEAPVFAGKNTQAFVFTPAPSAPQSRFYQTVNDGLYLAMLDILKEGKDINTALREQEEAAIKRVEDMKK